MPNTEESPFVIQKKGHRFFLPKKPEFLLSDITVEPDKWFPVIVPHELLNSLQMIGKYFVKFLGIEFPEGYDESSREHLWQTFFIICYNIPHDTPEIWVCVLNKLFTMGKFRVLINHDDKDMAKKVEKILMKAELCGQYITPSIIEWLSSWLDPSIHAEVMEQHEAFRLRADVTDITGVTNVTDVTALLSTN